MIFANMLSKVAEMLKRFSLLSKAEENHSQLLPKVATEFLSQSDMADILNNLNYDTEDFDSTPYDRHMDIRGMGAAVGVADMPGSSSGAMVTSTGSAGTSGLPDGHSQIFRSCVFGPSGFWTMAPLRYAAKFDPFLSKFCSVA